MSSETTARKNTQKLQRAIVDGLEDVKAQDIQVFNTETLSPLFERVIVATGTSNRQTKALAASVRDAVREAGFPKPRIEGEDNGEWIVVDCGPAVAHIMQPAIRQYYRLEEIWGEKPVRLKLGAPKPAQPTPAPAPATAGRGRGAQPSLRRSSAARAGQRAAEAQAQAQMRGAQEARRTGRAAGATAGKAPGKATPGGRTAAAGAAAPRSRARPAGKAAARTVAGAGAKATPRATARATTGAAARSTTRAGSRTTPRKA